MKSVFGNNLIVSLFGESHEEYIGITIHGLNSKIKIDYDLIDNELRRRRPKNYFETDRCEVDEYKIISGVFNGYTTGSPLTVIVKNGDVDSKKYEEGVVRPSHADYPAYVRYDGYNDYRGGGHFSGRITVLIVILGAICKMILNTKGISISSEVIKVGNINCNNKEEVCMYLDKIKENKDSVGGVIEGVIKGVNVGVGEPFFDSYESILSHLLFSIPSVKGVDFGKGVELSNMTGSIANDQLTIKDGKVNIQTNNNGGINGGLSNGNDIVCHCYFKPIPTIGILQETVNLKTMESIDRVFGGRHDACICFRAKVIVEAMLAYGTLDLLCSYYKEKWM